METCKSDSDIPLISDLKDLPEGKLKRAAEQRSDISFRVKILMKTFL